MTGTVPRWVCAVARVNAAERRFDRWFTANMWDLPVTVVVVGVPCAALVLGNALSVAILLNAIPSQGFAGLIVLAFTAVMDLFAGYLAVTEWVARRYGDALAACGRKRGDGA